MELPMALKTCDKIKTLCGIEMPIQWIPGHSDIKMNEKADEVAKKRITKPKQPYIKEMDDI